jgi:hypothetical protein
VKHFKEPLSTEKCPNSRSRDESRLSGLDSLRHGKPIGITR